MKVVILGFIGLFAAASLSGSRQDFDVVDWYCDECEIPDQGIPPDQWVEEDKIQPEHTPTTNTRQDLDTTLDVLEEDLASLRKFLEQRGYEVRVR